MGISALVTFIIYEDCSTLTPHFLLNSEKENFDQAPQRIKLVVTLAFIL